MAAREDLVSQPQPRERRFRLRQVAGVAAGRRRHWIALNLLVGALLLGPADGRPQELLERARAHHQHPDTTLRDYRARLNTLISIGFISDPLAPPRLILAGELAAAVGWDRAAGLQVQMLGRRYVSALTGDVNIDFQAPWFVATQPGDSLRLLGPRIRLPSRAAVHPFATGAEDYYDYAIADTIRLALASGPIELVEVRVTPTRGDAALVVGSLWVQRTTGAVAGMQVRFVGRPLWATREHPGGSDLANRVLTVSAHVEHALYDGRHWLPRRQEVQVTVRVPYIGDLALPVVFRSEFAGHRVNTGEPIDWLSPDSARAARDSPTVARLTVAGGPGSSDSLRIRAGVVEGRAYEIVRPSEDSLLAFDDWQGPVVDPALQPVTLPSAEELERRARQLDRRIAGRRSFLVQYDRLADLLHYNRVEALGLGLGARWDLPDAPFWSLGGHAGLGLADLEPKGRLDLRYDAPRIRLSLAGYSELAVAGGGLTGGATARPQTLRALLGGRDDADYYRASGAALMAGRRWGRVRARAAAAYEQHHSVRRHTDLALPGLWQDSAFSPVPPADEGTYGRGDLSGTLFFGEWARPGDRGELTLGVELGTGEGFEYVQPRAALRQRVSPGPVPTLTLQASAAGTIGDAPLQRLWRVGGLGTVRGYRHGAALGEAYWSVRLETRLRQGPIEPVLFANAGWAGTAGDWPGRYDDALMSFGIGVGLLWGLVRLDIAWPEAGGPWLEFYLGGDG